MARFTDIINSVLGKPRRSLVLTIILLLATAICTTLAVLQTKDLQDKKVPVAQHWSGPECANGYSSTSSMGLALGLFLGLGLGLLVLAFALRLIPLKYMNLGTEGLKNKILRRPDLHPKIYDAVSALILSIAISTVSFTYLMLLPSYDWNVGCTDSPQCVQAVQAMLDQGSSDQICCGDFSDFSCQGWWAVTFWLSLILVIAAPLAASAYMIWDLKRVVKASDAAESQSTFHVGGQKSYL